MNDADVHDFEAHWHPDGGVTLSHQGQTHTFGGRDSALRFIRDVARSTRVARSLRVRTLTGVGPEALVVSPEGHYYDEAQPGVRETIPDASTFRPRAVEPMPTNGGAATAAELAEPMETAAARAPIAPTTAAPVVPAPASPAVFSLAQGLSEPSAVVEEETAIPAEAARMPAPGRFVGRREAEDSELATVEPYAGRRRRESFVDDTPPELAPTHGWRGAVAKLGLKVEPSDAERLERADQDIVSQHWPGPRTIAVVNGKGGAGKALEVNEPVLTPDGWRPIGAISVGDLVIGRDGLSYEVLGVYPQGEKDLFRVSLTDGTSILATGDHLWEVQTAADRLADGMSRVVSTREMLDHGLWVDRGPNKGRRHNYFLPVAAPVKLDPVDVPIDPYLLGLLLGDGSLSDATIAFATADKELVVAVHSTLPPGVRLRHEQGYDYRIVRAATSGGNPLLDALRELGLTGARSEHKFVPELYKWADLDTRLAVLQGLMDTDGCVANDGVGASLTSVSPQLADDVQWLAESMGCVVTRGSSVPTFTHNGERRTGQRAFHVRIKAPSELQLFRLGRKRMQVRQGQRRPYRAVESIEPAGRGEAVCIAVASPDHLFLSRSCVPTHNTPTTICLAATFAKLGGIGVLAWDNNQTRGTLGWRTERGHHDATTLDLIDHTDRLIGPNAQMADLAHFVHHQRRDRFDVLRSQPLVLAADKRTSPADVEAIHGVAARYYRVIIMDSGNDESDPIWQQMIRHADQLVVATTTRDDHAEAGALLLEALERQGGHAADLARSSVVVINQADVKAGHDDLVRVRNGFAGLSREAVTVRYDHGMVDGALRLANLKLTTQRDWLRAAAAVARGL